MECKEAEPVLPHTPDNRIHALVLHFAMFLVTKPGQNIGLRKLFIRNTLVRILQTRHARIDARLAVQVIGKRAVDP